jgi:hypothetical protein
MLLVSAASNIVIEHAASNCTIAASKPTPMVILSLGHSGSTVTALRLAKLTGSGDGNPLGSERVTGSGLHPTSNRSKWTTGSNRSKWTPVHDIHAYFCAKQRERTAGLVGFKWKPLVLDLVETTPYAQAETVLNYEEVAARLAPTAYAHLLH